MESNISSCKQKLIAVTIVTVALCASFMTGMVLYSSGFVTIAYKEKYNVTIYEASWANSLQNGFLSGFGIPAVMLTETFGFSKSMGAGATVYICSIVAITVTPYLSVVYVLSIISGCALAICSVGNVCYLGLYFNKRRELAFTIFSFGGGIGGIGGSAITAWLLRISSLEVTLSIIAGLGAFLFLAPIAYKVLPNPSKENENEFDKTIKGEGALHEVFDNVRKISVFTSTLSSETEEKKTFRNCNYDMMMSMKFHLDSMNTGMKIQYLEENAKKNVFRTYLELFKDPRLSLTSIGIVCTFIGLSIVLVLVTDLVINVYHVSKLEASFALLALSAGGIFGRGLSIGLSFIKFSRVYSLVLQMTLHGIGMFLYTHTSFTTVVILLGVFGVSIGYLISILAQIGVEIFGVTKLPLYIGIMFTMRGVGNMIGAPIASILKENYTYDAAFYFGGSALLFGSFLLFGVTLFTRTRKDSPDSVEKHRVDSVEQKP